MTKPQPRDTHRSPAASGPRPTGPRATRTTAGWTNAGQATAARAVGGRTRPRSGLVAVVAALAVAAVLAGCGRDQAEAQVASLPTAATTPADTGTPSGPAADPASGLPGAPTSPEAPPPGDRPQMRLDDTPERRAALIAAWDVCLIAHGAQQNVGRAAAGAAGSGDGPASYSIVEPIPAAAKAACTQLLPLGPPELDPGQNPHYRDDWLALVACMRDRGAPVHLTKDTSVDPRGLSYTFDSSDAAIPGDLADIEQDCTLSAFGGQ